MLASVVIPVWNGADVLGACLEALLTHSGDNLGEVICVDNASTDNSLEVIRTRAPNARILSQPVNLGFAGGVNMGLAEAHEEIRVLLNQDCVVQSGWLEALIALYSGPTPYGIAGAVIYSVDGTVNHAGARIERPLAFGAHLTEVASAKPYPVEYVTGALFALHRTVWERVGPLDDAYYPAYFEECDYCERARRLGFPVLVAPDCHAQHLFTSRVWQQDPLRHTANQHRSRYRFICKQYEPAELAAFIDAEVRAIETEPSFHETAGRKLASAYTINQLPTILAARTRDGMPALPAPAERQVKAGFATIHRAALRRTFRLALPGADEERDCLPTLEAWHRELAALHEQMRIFSQLRTEQADTLKQLAGFSQDVQVDAETRIERLWRELIVRPVNFFTGRESRLQERLNTLQMQRLDALEDSLGHRLNLLETQLTLLEYRQRLTEMLADYEYA